MNLAEANLYILIFIITIFFTYILILLKPFHIKFSQDQIGGPQKIHDMIIPRIGGISIFLSLFLIFIFWSKSNFLFYLIMSSIPVFLSGLFEDLTKKVSASFRLLCTAISSIMCIFFINVGINSFSIEVLDNLIANTYAPYFFAFFSIILLTQSFNIIDGLNGLCILNAILILLSLIYVSSKIDAIFFFNLTLCILFMLLGLLFFNFPKPFIFIGDGGAYFLGFLLSTILIYFSEENTLSPFFCLGIVFYPIYETFRSFFRRLFNSNSSFMKPDTLHLHSLIYKKINLKTNFRNNWVVNSLATIFTLFFPALLCIWSSIYFDKRNFIIFGIILFLIIYECLMYYLKKNKF